MTATLKPKQLTIAKQLKGKDFPFEIKDKNGNIIYWENSEGIWYKKEYDANNNEIYYEDSDGYWCKKEYDANNNEIYYEDSNGHWSKREYDANNNLIYYEGSNGYINDKRPKSTVELTMDEIATKFGIAVKQLKIKK